MYVAAGGFASELFFGKEIHLWEKASQRFEENGNHHRFAPTASFLKKNLERKSYI